MLIGRVVDDEIHDDFDAALFCVLHKLDEITVAVGVHERFQIEAVNNSVLVPHVLYHRFPLFRSDGPI